MVKSSFFLFIYNCSYYLFIQNILNLQILIFIYFFLLEMLLGISYYFIINIFKVLLFEMDPSLLRKRSEIILMIIYFTFYYFLINYVALLWRR